MIHFCLHGFLLPFWSQEVHLNLSYNEILLVRKLKSQKGRHFVYLRHGNLMSDTLLSCETPYVREIKQCKISMEYAHYINTYSEKETHVLYVCNN